MKIAGILCVVLALAVAGLWAAHGATLATIEQEPVEVKSVDDFGDEVVKVEWKAPDHFPLTGFHIGLDRAAPPIGGLMALGGVLIVLGVMRDRKKAKGG